MDKKSKYSLEPKENNLFLYQYILRGTIVETVGDKKSGKKQTKVMVSGTWTSFMGNKNGNSRIEIATNCGKNIPEALSRTSLQDSMVPILANRERTSSCDIVCGWNAGGLV